MDLCGHYYLKKNQIPTLENLKENDDDDIIEFEKNFANMVGLGYTVSFAAGRMIFSLMKILEIEEGDEVILRHTCSVMVNAVFRVGATPIFADIDRNTFGSSKIEIEKKISPSTKMIVAQHSFGIPCDIVPILELARSKGIFLLEDCAISFGSKINGVQIGNLGDASLFSIDHSKPLNACIGGLIYTNNISLFKSQKLYKKLLMICLNKDKMPCGRSSYLNINIIIHQVMEVIHLK